MRSLFISKEWTEGTRKLILLLFGISLCSLAFFSRSNCFCSPRNHAFFITKECLQRIKWPRDLYPETIALVYTYTTYNSPYYAANGAANIEEKGIFMMKSDVAWHRVAECYGVGGNDVQCENHIHRALNGWQNRNFIALSGNVIAFSINTVRNYFWISTNHLQHIKL